jgi:predicted GNAT family acetyltransferase
MVLRITDAPDAERYEVHVDGDLAAVLAYKLRRTRIALIHTEVAPTHRGQGIAERLARFALDDARHRGLRVIPTCPYVRSFLDGHPEYHDIVVGMATD